MMVRAQIGRWVWCLLSALLIAGLATAYVARRHSGPAALIVTADVELLPANGFAESQLQVRASDGRKVDKVSWHVEKGRNLVRFESSPQGAIVRAGITPGDVRIIAVSPGMKSGKTDLRIVLDPTDSYGDGTPDFLRLQDTADSAAFRRWFTFLAESTYFQTEGERPAEVNDCAALIRYAYRGALHEHDGAWANEWRLHRLPSTPSVRKYEYPRTALGPNMFRTRPGTFTPEDISNGAFAEFADAETLRRFNTHFISRDLSAARPGDLIFFRQAGQRMPFHTMIYLGPSHFGEGSDWLIYHTGPSDGDPGELRRVTVEDLMRHPYARWRPSPQNPAFAGVYRWNILREAN